MRIISGRESDIYLVDGTVIKIFKNRGINSRLNRLLKKIDPNKEYFHWYNVVKNQPKIAFMQKLKKLPASLTRPQYRHLRKAIDILEQNRILHGDLPGNVMINPETDMPVIIDFDEGRIDAPPELLILDRNAFLTHFKVKK